MASYSYLTRPYSRSGSGPKAVAPTHIGGVAVKQVVKEEIKEIEVIVSDVLTRLLGSNPLPSGYILKNLDYVTGTVSGTAKLVKVYDKDGTIGYVPKYPTYT